MSDSVSNDFLRRELREGRLTKAGRIEASRRWSRAENQADLAAEREQRLVEALRERDGGAHDADCPAFRAEERPCNCGHEEVRAILATHEHNEGES